MNEQRMNEMKINKTVWKRISIVSLLLLFIFTIIYSWKDQPVALPENPIGEAIDSSKVPLEGEYKELLDELENEQEEDRKSTRLNSSHVSISYAVFCLKKK